MRLSILFSFSIIILASACYSQSGWITQNSNTTSELRDVQFINQQTGWAVGWSGAIKKTTNGGTSWFAQNSPVSGNSYQCCYFINDMTGWIGGGSQTANTSFIYKTTNGGENWTNQYYSNSGLIFKIWFSGNLNGWAAGAGGKILSTPDGGQSWIPNTSGVSKNLTNVFFINSNSGWVTGDTGTILHTTTGGAIWTPYYSGTTHNLEGIHFISTLTGWVSGFNGTILKTTDGGISWVAKPSGTNKWLNSVCFVNYNTGWIAGGDYYNTSSGIILRTTNGGDSWTEQTIPSGSSWIADVYFVNANMGWAVQRNGTIIYTINGGISAPSAPALIFPSNNAINIPTNTTFRWGQVIDAQHYTIQISTVSNFSVITDSITVDTNIYSIPSGKLINALTYFWRVNAGNSIGAGPWSTVWFFSTMTTGINTISTSIPKEFKVFDAYPNPFNPSTKIKFDVPNSTSLKMYVYDMSGRQVDRLFEGNISAGTFEYTWKAEKFNSGVYVIRFISNEYSASRKLILLK